MQSIRTQRITINDDRRLAVPSIIAALLSHVDAPTAITITNVFRNFNTAPCIPLNLMQSIRARRISINDDRRLAVPSVITTFLRVVCTPITPTITNKFRIFNAAAWIFTNRFQSVRTSIRLPVNGECRRH
jgi:hypothetical protein